MRPESIGDIRWSPSDGGSGASRRGDTVGQRAGLDRSPGGCAGPSRRQALLVGSLGVAGLSLPMWLRLQAAQTPERRRPKACIVLFLLGGPPQQETWDPKPESAAEYRGDLGVIRTATPGLIIGETMVRTARWTSHIAVLRACQTYDNAHSSSGYYMTTGRPHIPKQVENVKPGAPNDWPCLGAVVRQVFPKRSALPSAITLPEQAANDGNLTWPGQDAGFLGRAFDPWLVTGDPSAGRFEIEGLELPAEVPWERFDRRRRLLEALAEQERDPHRQQAFALLASPAARRALDLSQEPRKLRERYGLTRFGQSCLLARRFVEAGVPLVRVNWTRVPGAPNNGHWDTHTQNSRSVKTLMPILDAAYSALLEDLDARGLLQDTLVVWMAEFGRTPKINGSAGRDHWGQVFSVALAGGGIRGGIIYGASDKIAAYAKDNPVTPEDLHATIYHCLNIPLDTHIRDLQGRPLLACTGRPIRAILS
ncbi:MAG: DUF1501 domain-containing protein [Thermogemmata sp.]|uniref:DUF1501 domain-containing protein n=1 Tax=Thermogemmata fonticola TaxID=2755323 RepID=UPI001E484A1C|nr:DUF1501 domain-containing protein [Thermogemmata fonticola]